MRTNIDIDDQLLSDAIEASGRKTKKGAVEEALRLMVLDYRGRKALESLRGIGWEGDLDEMRTDPPVELLP